MFQVKIEKTVYLNIVNTAASLKPDAIFYVSNPNYDPLDGMLRKLEWSNLPTMSTYTMGIKCADLKLKHYLILL